MLQQILNLFLDILRGLNIYDQSLSITLDNVTSNDKMIKTILRHAQLQFPKIFHIR